MICENDVRTIVDLTGENKYPYEGSNGHTVTSTNITNVIGYKIINFKITCGAETRDMTHFTYNHWSIKRQQPDNTSILLQVIKELNNTENNKYNDKNKKKKIVVYCKTGTGRAGVFVCFDAIIEKMVVNSKFVKKSIQHDMNCFIDASSAEFQLFLENKEQYDTILRVLECVFRDNV
jgi:protein tyrosine phosphatase